MGKQKTKARELPEAGFAVEAQIQEALAIVLNEERSLTK